MLLAAVAGAAVPLWLWRADLVAHSLHFRLAAQTSLQPDEKNALKGLTLSIDGVELESPYLSVFELINDGSKPIAAADFESPIELRLEPNAFVARARVTATMPKDLEPVLVTDRQSVKLKPLLLNPADIVTIAIITSGAPPQFSPRTRIAGVAAVPLQDATKTSISGAKKWYFGALLFLFSYLCFLSYWIVADGLLNKAGVRLRRRAAALVAVVNAMGAAVPIILFFDIISEDRSWLVVLSFLGLGVAATITAKFWNRAVPDDKKTLESKHAT